MKAVACVARVLTLSVVVAFAAPLHIGAADYGAIDHAICGSVNDFESIAAGLVHEPIQVDDASFDVPIMFVRGKDSSIVVSQGHRYAHVPAFSSNVCAIVAEGTILLRDATSMQGPDLRAFAAVASRRKSVPFPLGVAPQSDTSVQIQARGGYVFVLFAPAVSRHVFNTCAGFEYYRVTMRTLRVEPFDGCVELHVHKAELPGIGRLPGR